MMARRAVVVVEGIFVVGGLVGRFEEVERGIEWL